MSATVHHIGYRFYTDRLDPQQWVYEEYLAEIQELAAWRVAHGLRDDYVRYSRKRFAEARWRRIAGLPDAPEPRDGKAEAMLAKLVADMEALHLRLGRAQLIRLLRLRATTPERIR